jgi:arylformamidase
MKSSLRFLVEIGHRRYEIRYQEAIALAEVCRFDTLAPNPFQISPPRAIPKQFANFVGDTAKGGSCNVAEVTIVPHCHGTHTESVSHVCDDLFSPADCVGPEPLLAVVLSVSGVPCESVSERVPPQAVSSDMIITAAEVQRAMDCLPQPPASPAALILRCSSALPGNEPSASTQSPAIYLSMDAMTWIRQREFQHLLVNLPSIDRADDGGALACHRIFWDLPANGHDVGGSTRRKCTITELLRIPDEAAVGFYLLLIQIPAWHLDAAPSRPLLLPLRPANA